jgi:hypothetical protein
VPPGGKQAAGTARRRQATSGSWEEGGLWAHLRGRTGVDVWRAHLREERAHLRGIEERRRRRNKGGKQSSCGGRRIAGWIRWKGWIRWAGLF